MYIPGLFSYLINVLVLRHSFITFLKHAILQFLPGMPLLSNAQLL